MPRYIPIELQDHLDSGQTTVTYLLRVDPRTPGFASYGVTLLNRDVTYNDGGGELTYLAAIGMQPSAVIGTADLAVDNAEIAHLLPEFDIPVSEADIRAGAYDYARFRLMLVNYEDLTQGHVTLHEGTIGQVTIRSDGLSYVNELRGLSAELRQSICEKDSLTCRATFGSQPADGPINGPIERFPCGYPAETLLIEGEVDEVGFESTLTFRVTPGSEWGEDSFAPGIVKFLTGLNAGRTFEISSNTADGWIDLSHDTPFPIQVGDELVYRVDCTKVARDAEKGCLRHWGSEWVLHFRGEPDIPIGDAGAMETPGASSGPGQGGYTSEPYTEAE